MKYGTITFWFEDEDQDAVDSAVERIISAVKTNEPELFEQCNVSEDSSEYEPVDN